MSFALTKGTDDEDATEFAYVACAYACVDVVNQAATCITQELKFRVFCAIHKPHFTNF